MMFHSRYHEIRIPVLRASVDHTAAKRGSQEILHDWQEIVREIREEDALHRLWENYKADNAYAAELAFDEVVDTVERVGELLDGDVL